MLSVLCVFIFLIHQDSWKWVVSCYLEEIKLREVKILAQGHPACQTDTGELRLMAVSLPETYVKASYG